jgi:aldehyde:ferredoxin oxidoreductase
MFPKTYQAARIQEEARMRVEQVLEMKKAHQVLSEYHYERKPVDKGYAGKTLYVNLTDNTIESRPVTEQMKEIFIGGKGFGLWRLWHAVNPDTKWDDPENEIVISSGPIGGTTLYPGAGKSICVTISPLTQIAVDSNVGGYYGPYLKFAGWDAIEIQGKAEEEVVVIVDGDEGRVTIETAPEESVNTHLVGEELTAMFAKDEKDKRSISVVSAGAGADHTRIGCLNFSWYDPRRGAVRVKQAGRGGVGTVFRDKKIKALVVRFAGMRGDTNQPADMERLRPYGKRINKEIVELDDLQCRMRRVGTGNLTEIMNDYDLLPVHNFRYGAHPDTHKIDSTVWEQWFTQGLPDGCWYGCTMSCSHAVEGYELKTGPYAGQKVMVDGPEYETIAGCGSNLGIFEPWAIAEQNFYCDTYGIDTISFATATAFAMECYEMGLIDDQVTGGLELNFGNAQAALEVLHQMARGEGFGLVVGQGVRRMKELFASEYGADADTLQDIGMENKGMEFSEYVTKESLAQQGGYGMTNKGAQHDEAWLIFMDMVNKQLPTFEDKAEALHYFPMWRTWFGLNGLCKLPWNDITPADNAETDEPAKVPEHVENYVNLFAGTTGREVTREDLISMSESVYNFQRVFNLRMGGGLRQHDAIPYRAMGPVTREEYESRAERYDKQLRDLVGVDPGVMTLDEKRAALRQYREDQYEQLIDAVYKRRGWTPQGVPILETLKRLKIDFPEVVKVIQPHLN